MLRGGTASLGAEAPPSHRARKRCRRASNPPSYPDYSPTCVSTRDNDVCPGQMTLAGTCLSLPQVKFEMSDETTLADLLQLDLHKYEDEVRNIVDKAVKESGMEKVFFFCRRQNACCAGPRRDGTARRLRTSRFSWGLWVAGLRHKVWWALPSPAHDGNLVKKISRMYPWRRDPLGLAPRPACTSTRTEQRPGRSPLVQQPCSQLWRRGWRREGGRPGHRGG